MRRRERSETRVSAGQTVSIPVVVRQRLNIEPGDVVVWSIEGNHAVVRVKKRNERGFQDFKPFDFGTRTHAAKEHDEVY